MASHIRQAQATSASYRAGIVLAQRYFRDFIMMFPEIEMFYRAHFMIVKGNHAIWPQRGEDISTFFQTIICFPSAHKKKQGVEHPVFPLGL
jgi:hypothetical protein